MSAIIRSKEDVEGVVNLIKSRGLEVNGTYELLGQSIRIPLFNLESLKDALKLDTKEVSRFIMSILCLKKDIIGPYDTSKYFSMLPKLYACASQLVLDGIDTRRAIVQFDESHCFQSVQFLVRENTVHAVCTMRSCNAIKNLEMDIFIVGFLCDTYIQLVEEAGYTRPYPVFDISLMIGSLHVFKDDLNVL